MSILATLMTGASRECVAQQYQRFPEEARPADALVLPEVAEGFLDRPGPGGLQGALEQPE